MTIDDYTNLSSEQLEKLRKAIRNEYKTLFEVSVDHRGILAVHQTSNIRFRLLPGGKYHIGLSSSEEEAARRIADPFPATVEEMRPVFRGFINPLLVSEVPVTSHVARTILNTETAINDWNPAWLAEAEGRQVAKALGCRFLDEVEWETMCRAGTTTLFPFGDELPDDEVLERWMAYELSDPMALPANKLGFAGLYFGEWTNSFFRSSYQSRVTDFGSRVVRGGGAHFWPWQDDEWVWCMSAVRMPASALPEGRCAVRLAFDLFRWHT
ncbi:MAG: hypothetical protein WCJ09_05655 [Planctomycetota bacterium]